MQYCAEGLSVALSSLIRRPSAAVKSVLPEFYFKYWELGSTRCCVLSAHLQKCFRFSGRLARVCRMNRIAFLWIGERIHELYAAVKQNRIQKNGSSEKGHYPGYHLFSTYNLSYLAILYSRGSVARRKTGLILDGQAQILPDDSRIDSTFSSLLNACLWLFNTSLGFLLCFRFF